MGILDFFRKKKTPEPEVELEEIRFDEIRVWLDRKTEEIHKEEQKVFDLISNRIELFIKEIDVKIKILEEIDVDVKKVEERAKILVKQGLEKYLYFVGIFTRELGEVEKQNLGQFIKDMNKIFADFDKHSYVFYKRVTYLIGNEIAAVKQEINNLSEYFTKLFKENQKIVDSAHGISLTRLKLKKLDETDANLDKINLDVKLLDKKIIVLKRKEEKVLSEIEKIKSSKDYAENLKRCEDIESDKKQLADDFLRLKSLVNFKALRNAFHSEEESMKIIKSYEKDFQESILKDSGKGILSLMEETELESGGVRSKIEEISDLEGKIFRDETLVKADEARELSEEVEKMEKEIENLKIEKVKHVKRGEVIEAGKGGVVEEVKEEVKEIGGIIF